MISEELEKLTNKNIAESFNHEYMTIDLLCAMLEIAMQKF